MSGAPAGAIASAAGARNAESRNTDPTHNTPAVMCTIRNTNMYALSASTEPPLESVSRSLPVPPPTRVSSIRTRGPSCSGR